MTPGSTRRIVLGLTAGRNGSWPSDHAIYRARFAVVVGPAEAFEIDVGALNLRTEGAVEPRRRQGVTVRQVQATIAGVLLVCSSLACSTSDSIDDAVEISFVQGGETEVCSVGPPEVACLAG